MAASAWPARMYIGTPRQAPRVEPAPAGVQATGAPLTIVRANAGAEALSRADYVHPRSADRLVVRAGPFRDHVVNWPEIVQAGLTALRHAAADTGDTEALRLLGRAEAHVQDRPATPEVDAGSSPVACPVFELGGQVVRTISTVMRFDTAIAVTTSQLRVELMFPADDASEAYFKARQLS